LLGVGGEDVLQIHGRTQDQSLLTAAF